MKSRFEMTKESIEALGPEDTEKTVIFGLLRAITRITRKIIDSDEYQELLKNPNDFHVDIEAKLEVEKDERR